MTNSVLVAIVCGSMIQILLCVGGCVALCAWCHKRCQRRRRRQHVNVVYVPAPAPPAGYPQSSPNYHPVGPPLNWGLPPVPSAPPPSYQEATSPGLFPSDPSQRPLVYSVHPQSYHPTFNPQLCPPKYPQT